MRRAIAYAAMIAVAMPVAVSTPAFAKKRDNYGRCKSESGTTGAVVGGVGAGATAAVLGADTLGTVAVGAGGALLGRHIDKKSAKKKNRRRGC